MNKDEHQAWLLCSVICREKFCNCVVVWPVLMVLCCPSVLTSATNNVKISLPVLRHSHIYCFSLFMHHFGAVHCEHSWCGQTGSGHRVTPAGRAITAV